MRWLHKAWVDRTAPFNVNLTLWYGLFARGKFQLNMCKWLWVRIPQLAKWFVSLLLYSVKVEVCAYGIYFQAFYLSARTIPTIFHLSIFRESCVAASAYIFNIEFSIMAIWLRERERVFSVYGGVCWNWANRKLHWTRHQRKHRERELY